MLHVAWPALAVLTLLVVVVIVLILKFGHVCFRARVTTHPQSWERRESPFQYQMEVLETSSARHSPGSLLKQPLGEPEPFKEVIDTSVQYGSREEAV